MNFTHAKQGWDIRQKLDWFAAISQSQKRDYCNDVVSRLRALPSNTHTLEKYGSLSIDKDRYPLFNVRVGDFDNGNPNILITAGVHGYEPSGIEAALTFLETDAAMLTNAFNFVVYPCISPWAYEFDHRWNAFAEDPNRNFSRAGNVNQIDECVRFMNSVEARGAKFAAAIDLHETPDRDIELRQERASRFGTELEEYWQSVPQGFYLMMTKPTSSCLGHRAKFANSIMKEVSEVSPIAPEPDLLGYRNNSGVIWAPNKGNVLRVYLGNHADQVAVTEVYPNHKDVGHKKAIDVQRAAIYGAIHYACS